MNKFKIYCTEEQTKKALELGAPIEITTIDSGNPFCPNYGAVAPTAEEMVGWLEEQEEISDLHIFKPLVHWTFELYASNGDGKNNQPLFNSRKEATIAAIDYALNFLIKNKK